jgi:prepilin-type N-terminal cleavage/methylation domain-containing protein
MHALPAPRSQHGVSLVELMAALSVLSVLAIVAVPSFAQLRQRSAVRGAAEATLAFWNDARLESIKRNRLVKVGVVVADDGSFCLGAATTEDPADALPCDCTAAAPEANACDVARYPADPAEWNGVTLADANLGAGDLLEPQAAVLEPMRTSLAEAADAGSLVLAAPAGPADHRLALLVDRLGRGRLCEPFDAADPLPEFHARRCAP